MSETDPTKIHGEFPVTCALDRKMLENINEKVVHISAQFDALTTFEGPLAMTNKAVGSLEDSTRRAHTRIDVLETAFKQDHDSLTGLVIKVSVATATGFAVLSFFFTNFVTLFQ